jgi:glyoxylase-like metal-dependent hydrolase (beta-lactamase superfamily II)
MSEQLTAFICRTCGVQYAPSAQPPERCPICEDERQYVGWRGQLWTTLQELSNEGRKHQLVELEPGLWHLVTEPPTAIGQRALIVQTSGGNVMWDCVTYVDDASVEALRAIGGLAAIAISHPHFYASMATWSMRFGNCPVYVHAADAEWVQYPTPAVQLWTGTHKAILPGVTLINTGGHFEGATVLHWADGAQGQGILLSGDSITVVQDRRYVSFMYSYPNLIPLSEQAVRRIVEAVHPYAYERIYGAWNGREVTTAGPQAVQQSADRYIHYLRGDAPPG